MQRDSDTADCVKQEHRNIDRGDSKKGEGNGNFWKTKNRYQLWLLLFNNNVNLKNNKRDYRKFISIRSW